jgi:hypothetical protein
MILPLAAIFFIAIHFWRIRKDGGLYAPPEDPGADDLQPKSVVAAEGALR